jgi:hypothetical protein
MEYLKLFADMTEAVRAWYFLMDSPKLHKLPSRDIFVIYGKAKKVTIEVAETTFVRHGKFLLGNMKKAEGVSWSQKPLYQYLRRHSDSVGAKSHSATSMTLTQILGIPRSAHT